MDSIPQLTLTHIVVVVSGLGAYSLVSGIVNRRRSDVHRLVKPANAHWLWGHEYLAWDTVESRYQVDTVKERGHVVALKGALFHEDILLVADPKALHHIYTTRCYNYTKSHIMHSLANRITGTGLIWAEGDEHKRQRQMLSPVFTHDQMRLSEDDIWKATNRMVDKLRDRVGAASTETTTVDILENISHATLDIIGLVGFGHDFQCGESPEVQAIIGIFDKTVSTGLEFAGFLAPVVLRAFPWILKLPVPAIEAQGEIRRIVRGIALSIVRDREAAQDQSAGKDLLSVLLKGKNSAAELDNLLDQATTFLFAGHETISSSLAFTCLELARHPDVQTRLRKEIQEFQGSRPGGEPTYNELQTKLPYLDAVCKEALRTWPAATNTERMAVDDDVIPLQFPVQTSDGKTISSIKVKKGQNFFLSATAVNRDPAIWGEDSEKFVPERWLEPNRLPPSDLTTAGFVGTNTFIEGPRMCIGYRLAVFEAKVLLWALVKQFTFAETDAKIESRVSVTVQPCLVGQREAGRQLPLKLQLVDA